MGLALAIDFGSTYTKVVAVDLAKAELIGVAQSASTVDTDITLGLERALETLRSMIGLKSLHADVTLSCSSAAGGLRMVVAGLVRGLTTKAAQEAALGAGAKIVGIYSNGLTLSDVQEIEQIAPDLILLAGGINGGNEEVIINNAALLATSRVESPIIIAGNRMAAHKTHNLLAATGKSATIVDNVLPDLDQLNVEPVRKAIRNTFMRHITHAKGLDKAQSIIGDIIMPTPVAVLNAATLLSEGTDQENGMGELIVVDVGGATIDVHSVAQGHPAQHGTIVKGLQEPYRKRTVEGDLGIRYNARSLLEMAGEKRIADKIPFPLTMIRPGKIDLSVAIDYLSNHIDAIPRVEEDILVDVGLASTGVDIAMKRHVGTLEDAYFPIGKVRIQHGKDLTKVNCVIGTGGIFAYGRLPNWILKAGCYDVNAPDSLRPVNPELFIDERYILFAMGLLAEDYPLPALRIMKKYLIKLET